MKLFNSKLLARLLCLLLALCMVTCCFAACDSTSGGRDDGEDEDEKDEDRSDKDDARDDLEKYELNGLTYYLSDDFGEPETSDGMAAHESDDAAVAIACGDMRDVADDDITTSKAFAQFFEEEMGGMYDDVETGSENGVYYVTGNLEGVTQICGFYVEDGYGWIIMAETEDEDLVEELIQYVTLGEIDKDFDAEDYLSASGDDYEDYEYEDIEVPPNTEAVPVNDTFTVHAYVPDSWGYPGCWAWNGTTLENVFDAWPGEPMNHVSGYYYTMEIPEWADYIIVNGNDGTIQTQDEPVEAGSDVWVVISADGNGYCVLFEEPDDALLNEYGY